MSGDEAQTAPEQPQLQYAPPLRWRDKPRTRRAAAWVLGLIGLLAAFPIAKQVVRNAVLLHYQRSAFDASRPFAERASAFAEFDKRRGGRQGRSSVLFLGERSVGNTKMLVVAEVPGARKTNEAVVGIRWMEPGSIARPATNLGGTWTNIEPNPETVQVAAGSSHTDHLVITCTYANSGTERITVYDIWLELNKAIVEVRVTPPPPSSPASSPTTDRLLAP